LAWILELRNHEKNVGEKVKTLKDVHYNVMYDLKKEPENESLREK